MRPTGVTSSGYHAPSEASPNFLILGAQMAGTTWLAKTLSQHPDIFIPRIKEIHYFDRDENFANGASWYRQQFLRSGGRSAVGEATPNYLAATYLLPRIDIIARITAHLPASKFIVSIRDPVARALSALFHHMGKGRLALGTSPDEHFRQLLLQERSAFGILEFGCYATDLARFFDTFDEQRFLILSYERHIQLRKAETLKAICRFLGVSDSFAFSNLEAVHHSGSAVKAVLAVRRYLPASIGSALARTSKHLPAAHQLTISAATRDRLADYYGGEIARLQAMARDKPRCFLTP
jgi:hypothetical protein